MVNNMNNLQKRFSVSKFNPLDQVAYKHGEHEIVYYVVDVDVGNGVSPTYTLLAPNGCHVEHVPEKHIEMIRSTKEASKFDALAMYIIVKNTAPIGLGINACSHAGFMAARKFKSKEFHDWEAHSFRKRTCLVSPKQFDECIEAIKAVDGEFVVFNENDWDDQDLSAAFAPRYTFPPIFKKIDLHPGFVETK